MNSNKSEEVLAVVVDTIRRTVGEDWIEEFEIGPTTRFTDDLDIESIEFVKMADALQAYYGTRVDIIGWLSSKSIHELIKLNVGDVAGYVAANLTPT